MDASAILIDAEAAAELLSTTPRKLKCMARDGRVPFVDLGDGEPRFEPEALRAWIQQIQQGASDVK